MSEMYFSGDTLRELDAREDVTLSKAHKQRACAVCQEPIDDRQAVPLNIGQGLEVLLHRECMGDIMDALTPKATTIPVAAKQAVSKSVTRKSVVTQPFDVERMAEDAKAEVYMQLLKLGLSQKTRPTV